MLAAYAQAAISFEWEGVCVYGMHTCTGTDHSEHLLLQNGFNCSDFEALFLALMRSEVRFVCPCLNSLNLISTTTQLTYLMIQG